jgi:hypothetical protein
MAETDLIRTPDQRLRVFVSSTLQELAAERQAVRDAVTRLRVVPVMFELGARPHPPDNLERAVRLLAAAGALLQAKGSGWLHALVPRAAHDDDLLAALHSRMGDAAYEQAWTQGRSPGSSRAIAYALQDAPPDPTRPQGLPRAGDTGAIS